MVSERLIINAVEKTIDDFKKYPSERNHLIREAVLCSRLYYNICLYNEFDFTTIISNTPQFPKNLRKAYEKRNKTKPLPLPHYSMPGLKFEKAGRYDIAIIDPETSQYEHIMEVKRLEEGDVNPPNKGLHKAIEDFKELTDYPSCDLFKNRFKKNCRSYNLIFVYNTKEPVKDEVYLKMKKFLDDVHSFFEEKGCFSYITFDNKLKQYSKGILTDYKPKKIGIAENLQS